MFRWDLLAFISVNLHSVCSGNVSSISWLKHLHWVSLWVILCNGGPLSSDWYLLLRFILRVISDIMFILHVGIVFSGLVFGMHELRRGHLPGFDWIELMHFLSFRILLRHHWSVWCDGRLRSGNVRDFHVD